MAAAKLIILGGEQAGAELPLAPGRYVLGSADDADLVLSGAEVRPRHAAIDISTAAWIVNLAVYQVISLGGTHLALGPDGEWPSRPEIPVMIDGQSGAAKRADAESPPADAESPPVNREAGRPSSLAKPAGVPRFVGFILFFMALAIALAGGVWLWLNRPPDPAGEAAASIRTRGFFVLYPSPAAPLPPGAVGLANLPGGTVALHGLVAGERERRAILAAAGLPESRLVSRLATVEEALAALADLLAEHPEIRVSRGDGDFTIRLSGLMDSAGEASGIYRRARENLDSRLALRRDLWVWPELRREAEREAGRLGLADARFERLGRDIRLEIDPWPEPRVIALLGERLRESLGDRVFRLFEPALAYRPPGLEPESEGSVPAFRRPAEVDLALALVAPILPELEPGVGRIRTEPAGGKDDPPPEGGEETPSAVKGEPGSAPQKNPDDRGETDPPIKEWQVAKISNRGFTDQDGRFHPVGGDLAPGLKLIAVWRRGVVLQRDRETLFLPGGSGIKEK